jgi:uncharacterized protein
MILNKAVCYHANCIDGLTAAWALWRRYSTTAEYFPVNYDSLLSFFPLAFQEIILADFSVHPETFKAWCDKGINIKVYEHHQGSLQGLNLPGVINNGKLASAMITWQQTFETLPPPPLVRYVQDIVLNTFKLSYSRQIKAYIEAQPFTIPVYANIAETLSSNFSHAVAQGKKIIEVLPKVHQDLEKTKVARVCGYNNIPFIEARNNVAIMASELIKRHPDAPFVAVYWQDAGETAGLLLRTYSLEVNLAKLINDYPGTGYPNTASLTFPAAQKEFYLQCY